MPACLVPTGLKTGAALVCTCSEREIRHVARRNLVALIGQMRTAASPLRD